ncbi:CoA-binding protein [Balneolaceae bacterium ANBcel3]|nr:CoA-binding protein [Balneolaceae bacterium ANBcel3]
MSDITSAIRRFKELQHIAVAGVSRKGNLPGNHICEKLAASGRDVYVVHPEITEWPNCTCYPTVEALPEAVEGLVVATHRKHTLKLTLQAIEKQNLRHIWFHRSFGEGSVDEEALNRAREHGLSVTSDGCPMMVFEPVDIFHRCVGWFKGISPE